MYDANLYGSGVTITGTPKIHTRRFEVPRPLGSSYTRHDGEPRRRHHRHVVKGVGGPPTRPGAANVYITGVSGAQSNHLGGSSLNAPRKEPAGRRRKGTDSLPGACKSFWDPVGASQKQSKSASADLNLGLGVVSAGGPDQHPQQVFRSTLHGGGTGQLGDGFATTSTAPTSSARRPPPARVPRQWGRTSRAAPPPTELGDDQD